MAGRSDKIKAAFYQFAPCFGEKEENLKKVFNSVKDFEVDLLVLPEFFATGYQFISFLEVERLAEGIPNGETTKFLEEISKKKGFYIVAGLPEKASNKFYNSAVFTGPEGFIGSYRKSHLFYEEKRFFSPGDTGFKVWETDVGCIGVMICFDWFFPESMRTLALKGADIVAHPSNLIMPYCPSAMPIRCLENRVYAITANRIGRESRVKGKELRFIGQSMIVSPDGEVCIKAGSEDEGLFVSEIDTKKARNKDLNEFNNIFNDRRPEIYEL